MAVLKLSMVGDPCVVIFSDLGAWGQITNIRKLRNSSSTDGDGEIIVLFPPIELIVRLFDSVGGRNLSSSLWFWRS